MNLRSKFLKKPWQQKDPEARAAAVRDPQDPELKAQLPQLAQHDESALVRLAALEQIDTEPFWLDARLRETDPAIVAAAERFLQRSILKSDDPELEAARLEWLALVDDAELIRKVAATAASVALRRAALARINAQGFLGDCYVSEPDEALADEILPRLQQASTLERIVTALRGRNKRRARAAAEALERIQSARGEGQAGQAASQRLVEEAEQFARGNFKGDREAKLSDLRRRWLAVPDHPEALAHRFDSAMRIAEAAQQRPATAALAAPEPTPAAPPEPAAPDPALAAAADQLRTRIRRGRKLDPTELLAAWDRAWNQLEQIGPADEQLKQDLLPLLRELQALVQQRARQKTAQPAAPAGKADDKTATDFQTRLDAVGALLEAGDIGPAHAQLLDLRREHDRLPARQRSGPVNGRLQRMEGRLKEMRDWQHWSNNQVREELIAQVELLPGSGQHPDAITAALKQARSEWKRLEALEVLPGDTRRFAASSGQWRRFQAACKGAFEAARPFFEKREQVQKDNLETLQAFIEAGQAAAASAEADSGQLLGFMRKARQAIRRMDDLPPKSRGASAAALRALMDRLSKRLDELFEDLESTKRKLVAEARALAHEKDLKTAVDKAKALQQQWQRAGSGRRKVEQQLWREFREPIDALFDQLKGEQNQRREADQQALAKLESLCTQAEALVEAADEELDAASARFNGLLQEWLRQDARPQRLNQRFERAERRLHKRCEDRRSQAVARERDRLWTLAGTLQDLWTQRCRGETADLSGQIPEVEGNDPVTTELIARARRIAAAEPDADELAALAADNLEAARQVTVEMEFLSGLDTPEADQPLRMDYQVKRLARRMSERERQPDLATEATELEARWLQTLPQPPEEHGGLLGRFQRARKVIEGMTGLG